MWLIVFHAVILNLIKAKQTAVNSIVCYFPILILLKEREHFYTVLHVTVDTPQLPVHSHIAYNARGVSS